MVTHYRCDLCGELAKEPSEKPSMKLAIDDFESGHFEDPDLCSNCAGSLLEWKKSRELIRVRRQAEAELTRRAFTTRSRLPYHIPPRDSLCNKNGCLREKGHKGDCQSEHCPKLGDGVLLDGCTMYLGHEGKCQAFDDFLDLP